MPARTPSSVEQRAARRVTWRERLLGGAALVFGKPRGDQRMEWDRGAPVLLYNRISGGEVPAHAPFGVTLAAFELHVSWMATQFELCTVAELVRRLEGGEGAQGQGSEVDGSRRFAAVTFGDGNECTYREEWPVLGQARAAGYRYLCTCRQHQTNRPRSDPFLVDRLEINRGDDIQRVERKLQGRYSRVYEAWYRLNPATRHWLSD